MPATVYFATNRLPAGGEPPQKFLEETGPFDGASVRFGYVEVPDDEADEVELHVARERLHATLNKQPPKFGSEQILPVLRDVLRQEERDVLVYIHGFDNSFRSALHGAGRLARVYREAGHNTDVFLFTWPSIASNLGYYVDRKNARSSGAAIGRTFEIFLRWLSKLKGKDICDRRVNLLAHSMGNYALRQGIQAVYQPRQAEGQVLPCVLNQVVLVGADDDDDALEADNKLKPLAGAAEAVTVYYTPNDIPLHLSDKAKFLPDRLGTRGPQNMRETPKNVYSVDVTKIVSRDDGRMDHWYHFENPEVVKDIIAVLSGQAAGSIDGRSASDEPRQYVIS